MASNQRVISSIERQKNRPRYNIYINEEYAFAVHEDILLKFQIRKGKEIDETDIREVLVAEERHRAEQLALRYLGYRPRTATQIRDYLKEKGFEAKEIEAVIHSFIEKEYINDENYAKQWVDERKRLRPRGRHLLKQELIQRGVEEDLIEEVLSQHLSDQDEKFLIHQLIQKKWKPHSFPNGYEVKKKMVPFLQRKGFSLHIVLSVVQTVEEEYIERLTDDG